MGATGRRIGGLALAAALVGAAGCGLFRDAEISSMAPGEALMSGQLECWLEIEFTGDPGGSDRRDVVVEFDSLVMPAPQRFDWAFIAGADKVRRGEWKGYKENEATSPDADPPLDVPIRVRFALASYERMQLQAGDELELTATLYWGGKQHSVSRGLGHVYHAEGSAL